MRDFWSSGPLDIAKYHFNNSLESSIGMSAKNWKEQEGIRRLFFVLFEITLHVYYVVKDGGIGSLIHHLIVYAWRR